MNWWQITFGLIGMAAGLYIIVESLSDMYPPKNKLLRKDK